MGLLDADVKQQNALLGEDTVDLFTVIEESFGFEFHTPEPVLGKSVREIAAYIARQSAIPRTQQCLSMAAFYRLRRALISLNGTPRERIKRDSKLDILFPWRLRRKRWRELELSLTLTLPALIYPAWLLFASFIVVVGVSVIARMMLQRLHIEIGIIDVGLYSIVGWLPVILLLLPLARAFPKNCETAGDLVNMILARNYAIFATDYGSLPEDQLLILLRRLVAAEVGLDFAEVTPETLVPQGLNIY